MDEYKVEFFIASDDEQEVKLTNLNEKDMEHWKRELEEQAPDCRKDSELSRFEEGV